MYQANFIEYVLETLINKKVNPSRLKFELTESMVLEDIEAVITKMHVLRECRCAFFHG